MDISAHGGPFGGASKKIYKKYAIGTATSSATKVTWGTQGDGAYQNYFVSVTGLKFKPSVIIIVLTSSTQAIGGTYYVGNRTTWPVFTGASVGGYTGAPVDVTANGFYLPFDYASASVTWYAFE